MTEGDLTELIQKAVAELKTAGAREVYIFGSAARGTMREGSSFILDFGFSILDWRRRRSKDQSLPLMADR
jgi:predicted nucleotidyltransferase